MADSGVMTMPGIPTALFIAAAVMVLASSLLMPLLLQRRTFNDDPPTRDLLRNRLVKAAVRCRPFQFTLQLPFVVAFVLIIAAGFLGTSVSYMNAATIITWTIWWAGLIIFILFFGKAWCLVCPWNAIAQWVQRFTLWGRRETTTSMNFRWPRRLRNIYAATGLFIGLTWLELGFGVTTSPGATAALAILILMLAVVPAMYYERNSFCRYACLVGRISGLYAMFAPTELRARDREVCQGCRTKDCVRGNKRGYGCPVFEYPGRMETNADCILCTECVKTCPKDNISFNIRPFAGDLSRGKRLRADEAYLALVMLSLTAFHGVTMTPTWGSINQGLRDLLGIGDAGAVIAFTLGMAAIIMVPFVIWYLGSLAARALSGREGPLLRLAFTNYAFAIIPIALFYHLAHNLEHLLREGQRLVPVLSDPFGWGWDLFGTARADPGPLLSMEAIQDLQVLLVLVGHLFAVYIAYRLFRGLSLRSLRGLVPVVTMLALFSIANLWLLAQPMQMRTGM